MREWGQGKLEQVSAAGMLFSSPPFDFNGFSTAVIDHFPVALLFLDENNRLAAANQAALDLLERERHEIVGQEISALCQPLSDLLAQIPPQEETRQEFNCLHRQVVRRFRIYLAPIQNTRSGATSRLILLWNLDTPYQSHPGTHHPDGIDIPTRVLFESILQSIQHGILVVDPQDLPLYFNPVLLSLWEEPSAYLHETGAGWPVLLSRRLKSPERLLRLVQAAREQPAAEMYDFLELLSGRVLECHSRPEYPIKGEPPVRVWSFEDITEQQHTEHELHYLSTHDGLTGLYNRAYFELQLRQLYNYPAYPVSMIMVDVDGLKKVNDRLGHPAGDALLIHAAGVLRRACRTEDVVARLGGDEFGILLLRANTAAVELVLDRIQHLQTLHNINDRDLPLSLSVGSATVENRRELSGLFSRADEDMYRNRWRKRHRRPEARHYWAKGRKK